MAERFPCEFSLIRYVPDVVKGEFTNIGVVLRETQMQTSSDSEAVRRAVTQVRFTRDWRRVRCIDSNADLELLEALEEDIAQRLISEATGPASAKPILGLLNDTLSNSIQITEPVPCLAESFATMMDELMRLYIETMKVKLSRDTSAQTGRNFIYQEMRKQFELAGVWAAMFKRYPVAEYTRKGDPMRLDCGYRPNGTIHIFHAISLAKDVDTARGLAFTTPLLRDGLNRKENAEVDLAAVVEPIRSVSRENGDGKDFTDEAADLYRFGVASMESVGIRVLTINDLARAAETARVELKL